MVEARKGGGLTVGPQDLESSDEHLFEAATSGDCEALERLIRAHYSRVFAYLLRLSGDYHVAEDLTQDVFYKAWLRLETLRGVAPLRTWLYRIAHNAYVDHARSWHQRRVRALGSLGDEDVLSTAMLEAGQDGEPDSVASMVQKKLERSRAARLLATLSPDHRSVVVLRFYQELKLEEIAEVLGIPLGTAKSRLHYAFKELRKAALGEEWGNPCRPRELSEVGSLRWASGGRLDATHRAEGKLTPRGGPEEGNGA